MILSQNKDINERCCPRSFEYIDDRMDAVRSTNVELENNVGFQDTKIPDRDCFVVKPMYWQRDPQLRFKESHETILCPGTPRHLFHTDSGCN